LFEASDGFFHHHRRQEEGIGKMQELPNWSRFVDLDGMGFGQGLSPVTPSRACAFRRFDPQPLPPRSLSASTYGRAREG
jgi:hypothetical protein